VATSSPFDKDSYFADRLAMEGISEDDSHVLGTPAEAFGGNGTAPQWVQMLAAPTPGCSAAERRPRNWEGRHHPEAAFLNWLNRS